MPRQQGSRGGLQLTVPQLFNEAQRVNDKGQRRFAGLVWELYAEDAQGTFDQLLACVKWILKAEEVRARAPPACLVCWPQQTGCAYCPTR